MKWLFYQICQFLPFYLVRLPGQKILLLLILMGQKTKFDQCTFWQLSQPPENIPFNNIFDIIIILALNIYVSGWRWKISSKTSM